MQDIESEFLARRAALREAVTSAVLRAGETMIEAQRAVVVAAQTALDEMQVAFNEFSAGHAAIVAKAEAKAAEAAERRAA